MSEQKEGLGERSLKQLVFSTWKGQLFIGVLATLSAYWVPLWNFDLSIGQDWPQFDNLSRLIRSNALSYDLLPVHDPWRCGGLDVLTNAQNRVFSPLFLLDLALVPHLANLMSLVVYGLAGFGGMTALLRRTGASGLFGCVGGFSLGARGLLRSSLWSGAYRLRPLPTVSVGRALFYPTRRETVFPGSFKRSGIVRPGRGVYFYFRSISWDDNGGGRYGSRTACVSNAVE